MSVPKQNQIPSQSQAIQPAPPEDTTMIWMQQPNESRQAFAAFCSYRDLDPSERSIDEAWRKFKKGTKAAQKRNKADGTWRDWSTAHNWVERATAHDRHLQRVAQAAKEEQIREVISRGFALRHKRIEALDAVAQILLDEAQTYDRRWLRDVKQVGVERVDIERFNAPLLDQLRGTLDDIAKEMLERNPKRQLELDLGLMTDEQLIKLITGQINSPGDSENTRG
jgi:hypothetical protein